MKIALTRRHGKKTTKLISAHAAVIKALRRLARFKDHSVAKLDADYYKSEMNFLLRADESSKS